MNFFEKVKISKPKRSNHDLSHNLMYTTDFGKLVPSCFFEVVPGDTHKVQTEIFCRVAPMLAPVFSQIDVYTHYFFVPMRLIYDKWEEFITGGKDGTSFPHLPKFVMTGSTVSAPHLKLFQKGSLWDYFGLPTVKDLSDSKKLKGIKVNLQIFQAYQLIYNEYYRDQNVIDEVSIFPDLVNDIDLSADSHFLWNFLITRLRAYKKDYFTSALPFAQRGAEVHLPIYGDADIKFVNSGNTYLKNDSQTLVDSFNRVSPSSTSAEPLPQPISITDSTGVPMTSARIDNSESLKVDLTTAHGATINEWRNAFSLQKFLEKNARSGGRYAEQLRSHFGVTPSDSRLQRPEYLGGGVQPIQIGEVVQTSESTQSSDLGELAGRGIAGGFTNKFKRHFDEHGFVIGITSILPKSTYYQGINRMFSRTDRYDFYFPEFANLGEQEIKNRELYQSGDVAKDDATFGYTPRYAEYKYIPDRLCGDFKDSLEFWHLGRKFGNTPVLGQQFLECKPEDNDRIFAVQSSDEMYTDHFWITQRNKIHSKRPMPYYGTPSF